MILLENSEFSGKHHLVSYECVATTVEVINLCLFNNWFKFARVTAASCFLNINDDFSKISESLFKSLILCKKFMFLFPVVVVVKLIYL